MKHLILFDIDGTLLHAGGAGARAFTRSFHALYGVPDAFGEVSARGRTDPSLIIEISERTLQRPLTDDEYVALKEKYIFLFSEELKIAERFRVMPGVKTILTRLSAHPDFLLGIETGNFRETAELKLRHPRLDHYFSSGGYGCDSIDRSEIVRIAIERAIEDSGLSSRGDLKSITVIGDSPQDILAARANEVRSILVLHAGASREEAVSSGADLVVDDLSNDEGILRWLESRSTSV